MCTTTNISPISALHLPSSHSPRSLEVPIVTGDRHVLPGCVYPLLLCKRLYLLSLWQRTRVHVRSTLTKCLTMTWHLTMCMSNLGAFRLALHPSFHLCFEEKFHIFFALILVARMAECHSWKGCVLELAQTEQLAQEKETIAVSRRFIYSLF